MKPFLGSSYHLEEIFILLILNEFRLASPFPHPFLAVDRIRVYRVVEFVFLLPREAVNDGEELPYVVGSAFKHWAFKQLCAGVGEHSPIFHLARVS